MLLSKLRASATAVILLSLMATGLGAVARVAPPDGDIPSEAMMPEARNTPQVAPAVAKLDSKDIWRLTIREALKIGLENDPSIATINLLGPGTTSRIAPTEPGIHPMKFKSDMIARIRSIIDQYWRLGQYQAQLRAVEQGVKLSEEVVVRLRSEMKVGRTTTADVAEADQAMERLRLNYVAKASEVLTAERDLRKLIGLPPADNRKIFAATSPSTMEFKTSKDDCLSSMRRHQPDIIVAKARLEKTRLKYPSQIESEQQYLESLVEQKARSLGRLHAEIELKQNLRQSAAEARLKSQDRLSELKTSYDSGHIQAAQYISAVGDYVETVVDEARFNADYATYITMINEAMGILLDNLRIVLVNEPKPKPASLSKPVDQQQNAPQEPPIFHVEAFQADPLAPLATTASKPKPTIAKIEPTGKTLSFQMTLGGLGAKPIEIKGSFSINSASSADPAKGGSPSAR